MRILAAVALPCLLAFGACTAAQTAADQAPLLAVQTSINANLAALQKFTVADANAAEADAVLTKDALSIPCYPAIATFITSQQGLSTTPLTLQGALLLHQKLRDVAAGVRAAQGASLVPVALKLACAPMVQDDATFIASLAAIGGAAAVVGPAAPALLGGLKATVGAALLK